MSDFERFEQRQLDQIRDAVLDYRQRFGVGDVTLAQEIHVLMPSHVSHDATLKNLQRLRSGKKIRNPVFLNACVQFLEIKFSPDPGGSQPELELATALRRYSGKTFDYETFWQMIGGDYAVHAVQQGRFDPVMTARRAGHKVGIPVTPQRLPEQRRGFAVLSIHSEEAVDYAPVTERYFLRDEEADDGEQRFSEANMLRRRGICLPLSAHDVLIFVKDFAFSHMYQLRREPMGFTGTMAMAERFGREALSAPESADGMRYDVVMQRTVWQPDGGTE